MSEQHDVYQEGDQQHSVPQGVQMFKDHIAGMKRGSRLLGGERDTADERGVSSIKDK